METHVTVSQISQISGYGLVFGHSNNKTHKGKEHFPISSLPPTLLIVLPLIRVSLLFCKTEMCLDDFGDLFHQ